MKNFLSILIILGWAATTSFAYSPVSDPIDSVSEVVNRSFKRTFNEPEDLKWYKTGEEYTAVFKQKAMLVKARFDNEGKYLGGTRFYEGDMLPLNIQEKIEKKYPGKKIFGVTETTENEKTEYHIKLQDEKFWYTLQVNSFGSLRTIEKYKK